MPELQRVQQEPNKHTCSESEQTSTTLPLALCLMGPLQFTIGSCLDLSNSSVSADGLLAGSSCMLRLRASIASLLAVLTAPARLGGSPAVTAGDPCSMRLLLRVLVLLGRGAAGCWGCCWGEVPTDQLCTPPCGTACCCSCFWPPTGDSGLSTAGGEPGCGSVLRRLSLMGHQYASRVSSHTVSPCMPLLGGAAGVMQMGPPAQTWGVARRLGALWRRRCSGSG